MTILEQYHVCLTPDRSSQWNRQLWRLWAAFITLGPRKHRIGYVCLDCGHFEFAPDPGYYAAIGQLGERRKR